MRSMFMLAALAAVISFTGCHGAGGCKLGSCKLGNCIGGGALAARGSSASIGDCGCGSGSCSSGGCGAGGACGSDSVVSVSAPYACESGCGEIAPMSEASSCGCSSCDGGAVQYAPMQHSAPVQSCGCSSCDSASTSQPRGFLAEKPLRKSRRSKQGMGLGLKAKGIACDEARPLQASRDARITRNLGVSSGASCEGCVEGIEQTVAQMPDGFLFGSNSGGRRISSGIVADVREARGGRHVGGCRLHGRGAGVKGCAQCARFAKLTGAAANVAGFAHPYGGVVPHTNPAAGQQPQSGIAPQYAYPYYTTRGPRDFLQDNPPSIGY